LGQVVDAAMVDGASLLMTMMYGARARDQWTLERGTNRLDGGAPFYGVYECADGRYLAVGAIEPQFWALFVEGVGGDLGLLERQLDQASWPADRQLVAELLATRTRDEWCEVFAGDACVAPVLDMSEVAGHPHNVARETFIDSLGAMEPGPAPRFSRTPGTAGGRHAPGADTVDVLSAAGFSPDEISELAASGAVHLEPQVSS
jgi:alpha-methylacyl-CoA racemase